MTYRDSDMRYKNTNFMSYKKSNIRSREPLEIQTIRPNKYLKWTNELEYNGHILPILINYKVIRHTLTY